MSHTAPHTRALGVNFAFLTRLRWAAVVGQLLVVLTVRYGLGTKLPLTALFVVIAAELLFNIWCAMRLRSSQVARGTAPLLPITVRHVTLSVGVDLLLFSLLLYFTGGPANPFSFLYLIHIALAALVLPPRVSYALVAAALACSLLLFWVNVPLPHDHAQHMHEYGWHLRGMWVAFGLAAGCIVYFIQRVLRELRGIEEQLAASRERETRSDAVAALAMLSAGAAHELASPLSTIALASGELLRRLPEGDSGALRDDLLLIRGQVERCRSILDQLAAEAGQAQSSSFGQHSWQAVVESSLAGLDRGRISVQAPEGEPLPLHGSLGALVQALKNLVSNALEASAPTGPVTLRVSHAAGELAFAVEDRGPGMPPEVLARCTEPFFTTKPRGRGMGLGLFLAQSVAEQMGGRLEVASDPGRGTQAKLVLPTAATIGRMVASGAAAQAAASHG